MTALALAPAAGALSITGVSINTLAGNTGPTSGTGSNHLQVASSTSVTTPGGPVADTVGANLSFDSRYAWLVMADQDNGSPLFTQSATADYQILFSVQVSAGASYQIDIGSSRVGSLTLVDEHAGSGTATLGAMTGSVNAITQAALGLTAFGPLASSAGGDSPFTGQSGTYSFTAVGTGAVQNYVVRFTWNGSATTNNDEAAIRMGIAGSQSGVSADDYPGTGGRTAANDGHLVNVKTTIISTPEPAPAALVALGLVALALRRSRARSRA